MYVDDTNLAMHFLCISVLEMYQSSMHRNVNKLWEEVFVKNYIFAVTVSIFV